LVGGGDARNQVRLGGRLSISHWMEDIGDDVVVVDMSREFVGKEPFTGLGWLWIGVAWPTSRDNPTLNRHGDALHRLGIDPGQQLLRLNPDFVRAGAIELAGMWGAD
jgi:hypothetical protein